MRHCGCKLQNQAHESDFSLAAMLSRSCLSLRLSRTLSFRRCYVGMSLAMEPRSRMRGALVGFATTGTALAFAVAVASKCTFTFVAATNSEGGVMSFVQTEGSKMA